jgi:hypothetical protein
LRGDAGRVLIVAMKISPRFLIWVLVCTRMPAAWVWVEGEQATQTNIGRHPWYAGQVKKDPLSGGNFLAHFDAGKAGEATYAVQIPEGGTYTMWLRANPVQSSMTFSIDGAAPASVDFQRNQTGNTNIAADGAPDLRFLAWCEVGQFPLKAGAHTLRFVMNSANHHHGAIDCFVFTTEPFAPNGVMKPDQLAAYAKELAAANAGWTPWIAKADDFKGSAIDLRFLNERFAGEHGRIVARGEHFVHAATGQPVRFWGVNGPPHDMAGADLATCARMLAKHGVNLVRIHGAMFDGKTGVIHPDEIKRRQAVVAAMGKEGIYSLLSIYFPLWMTPENGSGWREGYDGKKHPFALLYFEPEFQALYQSWWRDLLTKPDANGKRLVDDPAIMALELVNEDSFFFWTFNYDAVPAPQMRKLETLFGDWAKRKHGSLEKTLAAWNGLRDAHDDVAGGRLGFRPLYEMFMRKTPRDQDTAAFLLETQRKFYADTVDFLRGLGYKGMITASNWITANDDVLGPLEKLSYMPGDFVDHHGYFGSNHRGNESAWSIRTGHTYSDVSALRFDAEKPGAPRQFRHPAMDPMYNGRPSTISETTWNRPNRYRGEAPLFYAVYGALQDTDAVMHFALDSGTWSVKPGFFMQPWTLMSPTQMGQFPAAALIYRRGLIRTGDLMADLPMKLTDALALKGSKLVQQANLDELRKADVAGGAVESSGVGIDPLIHFAGRTNVRIDEKGGAAVIKDTAPFIDRVAQTVFSSARELKLDYGKGVLYLNAPAAQGISGNLKLAGSVALRDVVVESGLELGQIVAVSLDGRPLAESGRILVQAMTEEKPADFATEPAGDGVKRITNLGHDPWLFREIQGTLRFKRADAARLKVTALDLNGYAAGDAGTAAELTMKPGVVYYLIEKCVEPVIGRG